ncbi:glutathione S-transferase [Multifurca ochricompacta]|uniref:glutathione transferase n=1 Tax=Multifurca ochricompacta TaxID=376703 RepID=A0AAD4QKP9_9AGAM|nr:glutathione S-transferase [Multifurca ochricompacta]
MSFKLYSTSFSDCTRRITLVAKERNIPYEFVPVDFKLSEQKTPAHLEHNPFGQVPYIQQDDGFELYESRAIGRYLATQGSGPELIPTDPIAYAKFEQAASVEYSQFDPIAAGIATEKVFKLRRGLETNEERVKELVPLLGFKLDGYEIILSKQKYLAGNVRTYPRDLYHLPYGTIRQDSALVVMMLTKVCVRWWNDISSRESWKAVKGSA